MRTKLVPVLAGLLVAATMAACGNTGRASPSGSAGATAGSSSAKPVTISFWNEMTGPYKVALSGEIAAFEAANKTIHVQDIVVPNDATLQPKLLAGVVGHSLPTLSQLNPQWAHEFLATGSLVPLSSATSPSFGLSNFYSKLVKSGTGPGGKQYLLPFNVSDAMMFYNQTAFSKAGISSPPATWSELTADASRLSGGRDHAFAITLVHSYPWRAFFYEAGGHFEKASGAPNPAAFASTGPGVAALRLWRGMVKNGSAILTQGYASQTDFANQTSSIVVGTSAFYPYLAQAVGNRFKIGIAPLPKGVVRSTSIFGGYLGIFSSATTAQRQAASKFVQYLTSKTGQQYWMQHSDGYLPVRKDVASSSASFLASHPAQAVGLEQLASAAPEPKVAWWDQFDTQGLIPAVQSVMIGRESAVTAMAKLQVLATKLAASSSP